MWDVGHDESDAEFQEPRRIEFENDLFGVVSTAEGPYAIGSGGVLVADRSGDGDHEWEVELSSGPHAKDNALDALAVTDDGKRLWFVGSSGALGCYDVEERRKYDYSHPKEMTSTWEGVAVCGNAGKEKALAANGSGEVLPFTIDGFDVDWGVAAKPVSGKASHISALAATPGGIGFAVDTSGQAYKTSDDDGWIDIGIVNAQVKFHDVYAGANERVYVAGGDGKLYRYDDSYHSWTPIQVAKEALHAVDVYEKGDGNREMVVLGASGTIYQRTGEERWQKVHSPTSADLNDVTLGHPDVAVGDNATVLIRPRDHPRNSHAVKSADGDQYDGRGENYDGDGTAPGETGSSGSSSSSN